MTRTRLMRLTFASIICVTGLSSVLAYGKSLNLPKGIGLWSYSYRSYDSMSQSFDRDGYVESIGDDFGQNFTGESLVREGGSSDLNTLAEEVRKFDYNGRNSGVLAGLDLGALAVDVDASVSTHIIGLGYGLADWLTVYAGFPIINVSVKTDMYMTGNNTANDLKARLGDLSYEELKDGLETASGLNVSMVKDSLNSMGYEGIENWEHSGIGDINIGAISSYKYRPTTSLGFTPYTKINATIPTGHVDDPNILTDTSTGYGYFSTSFKVGQIIDVGRYAYGGIEGTYQHNFSYQRDIRRPETKYSSLAPLENLETVEIDPGDQTEVGIYAGATYGVVSAEYKLVDANKKQDVLLGEQDEVYEAVISNKSKNSFAQIISLSVSTAELYQQKIFPVPFIASLVTKTNLAGKNAIIDDYFEFTLSSFFTFN